MYYTYVLKSKIDNKHYVGWTNDLKHRILSHNNGKVESTALRRPLTLVYYEACLDEKKAIHREKFFKTGYGRKFLKSRI
jgi:putative endonuclease